MANSCPLSQKMVRRKVSQEIQCPLLKALDANFDRRVLVYHEHSSP